MGKGGGGLRNISEGNWGGGVLIYSPVIKLANA